jgi:vacuolar-type H+-ATPase subunit I/STV1
MEQNKKQVNSEVKKMNNKNSVQGTGDRGQDALQKVIKLAKDLALGQLQMSEEVWENHVKKGANGILALLGKISSEQAEQLTFMGMRVIKNDNVPDDEIWLIKPSGRIHKITNIEKSEPAEQPKAGQESEFTKKVLAHFPDLKEKAGEARDENMITLLADACDQLDAAQVRIAELEAENERLKDENHKHLETKDIFHRVAKIYETTADMQKEPENSLIKVLIEQGRQIMVSQQMRDREEYINRQHKRIAELEAANSELRTHNTEQRQQIAELEKQLADVDYTASYLKGKKDGEDKLRAEINLFISSYQKKNESGE